MQIVIEIDEYLYKTIKSLGIVVEDGDAVAVSEAIMNGIPLPKGHGRLIDADTIAGDGSWDWSDRLDATPTIIEADTERSENDTN